MRNPASLVSRLRECNHALPAIRIVVAIRRSIAFVLVVSVIVLAGAAVALVFTKPDRYRPEIIAYLQDKIGKQIQIRRIGVSLVSYPVDSYIRLRREESDTIPVWVFPHSAHN